MADEFENLTITEREQLKRTFLDLIRETPETPLAESRFKKLMKKTGGDAYEGMKKILIDVVAEVVKKSMYNQ